MGGFDGFSPLSFCCPAELLTADLGFCPGYKIKLVIALFSLIKNANRVCIIHVSPAGYKIKI